ncbi:alpha/beta fold hydrolase [Ramlibacter albus]|uniref:Alpha/beta hydrolase n=1 Tax=Ramlibacter albus TaxID=2079448 RepID=A0A923MBL6_9BURK|nr:alpha/beta hydrolase [Ramlibacter albus]MBC5766990.1 alpha/beta hydrolase [Ramlibacter albus]
MSTAVATPNRFAELKDRRIAYRVIGEGRTLLLLNRFRGNLDTWDPAFLDGLAAGGLRVITFDYSGLGLSTGAPSYDPSSLARDAVELMAALDLTDVAVGGWSIGGIAAQLVMAMASERVAQLVLVGTTPPGPLVKTGEQLFYDLARKPVNTHEDEVALFFEPKSEASREAAKQSARRIAQRTEGRSPPVDGGWAARNIGDAPKNPLFPAPPILQLLKATRKPILHVGGDHDIICPVENWYALNGALTTLQVVTFPQAGHGPQHQYPQASAAAIATFVRNT